MNSQVISDPAILGGTPVFMGTRVPVSILFEHIEAGDSLDEFLESFPSVTREQTIKLIGEIKKNLIEKENYEVEVTT